MRSNRPLYYVPILACLLVSACADPVDPVQCGNQVIDEGEFCDGANLNGKTCLDFDGSKDWGAGTPACNATCSGLSKGTCVEKVSEPGIEYAICGNTLVEPGEICDKSNLNGLVCANLDPSKRWMAGGTPVCASDCKSILQGSCVEDTSSSPVTSFCGNNTIEGTEVCDGTNLNGKTCRDFDGTRNWASGEPSCTQCKLTIGTCKENTDVPQQCGNNTIEGTEVCDGTNLNGKTCRDFDSTRNWASGEPSCTQCKLTIGSCKENSTVQSVCGNEEVELGEACELLANGAVRWSSDVAPTCEDYSNAFEWRQDTGEPGCKQCKLDRGTCEQVTVPASKNNIESCSFTALELDTENGYITAYGEVFADSSRFKSENLSSRLVCTGQPGKPTYEWAIKADELLSTVSEDPNSYFFQFGITSSLPIGLNSGTLACSLTVQSNTTNSTSWFSCPLTEGSPLELSEVLTSDQYRTVTIDQTSGNGEILAKWTFDQYPQKATNVDAIIKPNEGTAKNTATLQRSAAAKTYTTYAGISDSSALASSNWGISALDYNKTPYWKININASGYSDIKIQFAVAASGNASKSIAVAYKDGGAVTHIGQDLTFSDKNTYHAYPSTAVVDQPSGKDLEIRIYGYKFADENATMRIDDVIVTGTPL